MAAIFSFFCLVMLGMLVPAAQERFFLTLVTLVYRPHLLGTSPVSLSAGVGVPSGLLRSAPCRS